MSEILLMSTAALPPPLPHRQCCCLTIGSDFVTSSPTEFNVWFIQLDVA